MKCVVLAGGSGDALWPLSRKNYPKQFMNIRKGRSLFQEAIARNLPFCDDFLIITNKKYRYIAEGQLQAFQGLSYQMFLEEIGRQTAPAVAIASMCVSRDEDVLVVSTDHFIDEGDYNATILEAKKLLSDDNIVVVGADSGQGGQDVKGHSAFLCKGQDVVSFIARCDGEVHNVDEDGAKKATRTENQTELYLDCGIFVMKAGTYLDAIAENAPDLYRKCQSGTDRVRVDGDALLITEKWLSSIPSQSVGDVVFSNWAGKRLQAVKARFVWSRLLNTEALSRFEIAAFQGPSLTEACRDVSVLNETADKLVVVNDCEDLVVVNTKDAVYISKKGESPAIRDIMNKHYEEQKDIFDEGDIFYTPWGIKETLTGSSDYTVRKITLFPGREISLHKHEKRIEHYSVVSGTISVTVDGVKKDCTSNDNVFVPVGIFHKVANETAKDAVYIEVSVGDSANRKTQDVIRAQDDFVKLSPSYKDYLWGGTRLYEIYGKENPDNEDRMIAESWEVSAHPAGPSVITEGNAKGMLFSDYLNKIGKDAWGWKCKPFDRFPLLIKFIDATKALSVQVHPDDDYAMRVEGDYGKNEMWYIMDAEEDAGLYVGFKEEITREECEKHIKEGTLTDVLNRIPVKKGDVVFVRTGTVHAILEGLLVLEIQQSSNATYRLYDYDRTDKYGNRRELHLDKALDNLNFQPYPCDCAPAGAEETGKGYIRQHLGECKYFSAILYTIEEQAELSLDDASFSAVVFLHGSGTIQTENQSCRFRAGDSFFIPAGKKVLSIVGSCQFVLSRV